MFEIKHRTAKSKINCEELDPLPLSGVGIELDAVLSFPIYGWRLWVEHLERVTAASRARENTVGVFFLERRRGRSWPRLFLDLCRERFLLRLRRLREGQARDRNKYSQRHELFHLLFLRLRSVLAG